LPYADFRSAIEADFPVSPTDEGAAGTFSTCPVPQAGAQDTAGPLRLIYAEDGQLLLWDESVDPLIIAEADGIEQVRLSPDGETAVYASQPGGGPVQLWAISLDEETRPGEPRPLAGEGQLTGPLSLADFSPDGQLIAFTHQIQPGSAELWSARLDGSSARRLVSEDELRAQFQVEPEPQGISPFGLAWIPGTQQLVYGAFPHYEEGLFIYIPDQVYQVDAATGQGGLFLVPGTGGELVFAPDGKRLAIQRIDSLSLYDLEAGGEPARLDVPYYAIGFGEYYYYPPVHWSQDSSRMLAALPQDREYTPAGLVSLWEIPADGSQPVELAQFTGFAPTYKISPDLSRMAYWYAPPESNDRELHLANVDGSEDVLYNTSFLVDFLDWAPDSQRFVYTTGGSEEPRTWLGDICAGPVELADYLATPFWLGGDRLLLVGDRDGVLQLAEANFAGEYSLLLAPEGPGSYAFTVLPGE
jgi:dipeptidyl aminopeptidase/acylaminoacyl peptidase